MKMTKRCEYILEDGHKCNAVFTSRNSQQKYCDNHIGNTQKNNHLEGHTPLVKSTNRYAQGGNNDSMRQWVMHKMNMENIEKKKIADLEARVARLEKIIDNISSNKKVLIGVLKEEMRTDFFKQRVGAIVVKRLQKSFRGEEE
jgi:phosphopantetheine adenylyltransferase